MSPVFDILEQSAEVIGSAHSEDLVLKLNGASDVAIQGYVQLLDKDPAIHRFTFQQLHVAESLPTHAVHVLREDLVAAGVSAGAVREITAAGVAATYRVRHFTDDGLARPEVMFLCTLA